MWKKAQNAGRREYRCSFCGKEQSQVERLIAGPGSVYICNECVELCREIIEEEHATTSAGKNRAVPSVRCSSCGTHCPEAHTYCFHCGQQLVSAT